MRRWGRLLGMVATFHCYMPGCSWSGATYQDWQAHLNTHY